MRTSDDGFRAWLAAFGHEETNQQAADAYARMMDGKARFRIVLVTKEGVAQGVRYAA